MRIGILAAVCLLSIPLRAENPVKEEQDKFNLAVECIKRFEGWHGERKHWPYVGWGHKVLPGEKFTNNISKAQGDSILRADLRKLCRMFSYLGRDSFLLSEISDKIKASFPYCRKYLYRSNRSALSNESACASVISAVRFSCGSSLCP